MTAISTKRWRASFRGCVVSGILGGTMIATTVSALAQSPGSEQSGSRLPRIGLVLEGGGALGLAHIGVIQWLEEHHIPVHYIAGTSMGGLVGGVYATGRSPSEVRDLVESIDWDDVLRGQVPFQNLSFRRQQDAVEYPGAIEFGIKKGIQFPEGFNSGQEVQFILDRVALPYSTIPDFDQLPIPYRCVATDLVSGKKYVFHDGSFATAMRATMSLPGFFSPVRVDGHIFADGGLLDNLPVDVAKDMGADVTLAVYLETQPMSPNDALSSFGVLGQSVSVAISANEVHSLEAADILISVPVAKFGAMDYDQAPRLIKAGYDAAQSKAAVLARFAVDESTWEHYLAQRTARRRETANPQFVAVVGTDPHSAKAIAKAFQPMVSKPIDIPALEKNILDLEGEGRYSSLSYSTISKDGSSGLLLQAQDKNYAPPTVRPEISLDGSQYNNVLFRLGARITFLNVGSYQSELRTDFVVGSEYGLSAEYYHPLVDDSRWFVAPHLLLNSNTIDSYASGSDNLASVYRVEQAGGGADLGYELGRSQELRLGYFTEYLKYSLQVGSNTEPAISGRAGYGQFRYTLLHVDDPVIPKVGSSSVFNTQWHEAYPKPAGAKPVPGFPSSQGNFAQYLPLGPRNTLTLGALGGTAYGTSNAAIGLPIFSIGGPRLLSAYGTNEILTNQYFDGQLTYLRDLAKLPPFLGGSLYALGRFEGGTYQRADTPPGQPLGYRHPADFAAGAIVNTIFGPVLIGAAAGDAGHYRFFFSFGRIF